MSETLGSDELAAVDHGILLRQLLDHELDCFAELVQREDAERHVLVTLCDVGARSSGTDTLLDEVELAEVGMRSELENVEEQDFAEIRHASVEFHLLRGLLPEKRAPAVEVNESSNSNSEVGPSPPAGQTNEGDPRTADGNDFGTTPAIPATLSGQWRPTHSMEYHRRDSGVKPDRKPIPKQSREEFLKMRVQAETNAMDRELRFAKRCEMARALADKVLEERHFTETSLLWPGYRDGMLVIGSQQKAEYETLRQRMALLLSLVQSMIEAELDVQDTERSVIQDEEKMDRQRLAKTYESDTKVAAQRNLLRLQARYRLQEREENYRVANIETRNSDIISMANSFEKGARDTEELYEQQAWDALIALHRAKAGCIGDVKKIRAKVVELNQVQTRERTAIIWLEKDVRKQIEYQMEQRQAKMCTPAVSDRLVHFAESEVESENGNDDDGVSVATDVYLNTRERLNIFPPSLAEGHIFAHQPEKKRWSCRSLI